MRTNKLHVTQDSVLKDVCYSEVQSAQRPITRFSSIEYQRALKNQVQRFERSDYDLPDSVLYLIDKMVRLRTKELRFGYDHSEVLNLERILREPFVEGGTELKSLKERNIGDETFNRKLKSLLIKAVPPTEGLSFEEWKLKKEAEARIKSKLIEDAIQEEVRKRLAQEEEESVAFRQAQDRIEEWTLEKREEARQRLLEYEQRKQEVEELPAERRAEAVFAFKEWLKNNFVKLREAKRLEQTAQTNERLREGDMHRRGSGRAVSVESGPRRVKIVLDTYSHKENYKADDSRLIRDSMESDDSFDISQLQVLPHSKK